MQIRRPRGVTVPQLMVVTAIGVLGGIYIWQPLILKYKNDKKTEAEPAAPAETSSPSPKKLADAVTIYFLAPQIILFILFPPPDEFH